MRRLVEVEKVPFSLTFLFGAPLACSRSRENKVVL